MSLGGDKLCGSCLTMSAAWTGGTCSACMLRKSNEEIAKKQMQQMEQMQQNNQYSYSSPGIRTNTSGDEWTGFIVIIGVLAAVATLIWSASTDMTWLQSVGYIFWYPIKMFFSSVIYIATLGHISFF